MEYLRSQSHGPHERGTTIILRGVRSVPPNLPFRPASQSSRSSNHDAHRESISPATKNSLRDSRSPPAGHRPRRCTTTLARRTYAPCYSAVDDAPSRPRGRDRTRDGCSEMRSVLRQDRTGQNRTPSTISTRPLPSIGAARHPRARAQSIGSGTRARAACQPNPSSLLLEAEGHLAIATDRCSTFLHRPRGVFHGCSRAGLHPTVSHSVPLTKRESNKEFLSSPRDATIRVE